MTIKKKAIFSIREYFILAPWKAWLTGCWTLNSSRIKAELTAVCDIDRYNNRSSPFIDGLKSSGLARYSLRLWKAASHLSVHWKTCLKFLRKGGHLLVVLEMNLFRVTIHPFSLYTSFTILGSIAFTFSGFASIPCWETMKPRNFPNETPNTHLARLSFIQYFLRVSKISWRLSRWDFASLLFTSMSST